MTENVKISSQLNNSSFSGNELHCHVSKKDDFEVLTKRNAIAIKKLITVLAMCALFMIGEMIGGLLANSISIQTDAAHLASDIIGFFLNIIAIFLSENSIFFLPYNFLQKYIYSDINHRTY
jgi:Co/Zn/Cd efflux system component